MSSRRQRWGYRHHDTAPAPTLADIEADLYHQRWEFLNGVAHEFYVLGFDDVNAETVGATKLASDGVDLSTVRMVKNELITSRSEHTRAAVLLNESPEASDARQREHRRRIDEARTDREREDTLAQRRWDQR